MKNKIRFVALSLEDLLFLLSLLAPSFLHSASTSSFVGVPV